jgi:3-phenylpropionate/trans-cinnamate dioxygenase ferredoxin subunit
LPFTKVGKLADLPPGSIKYYRVGDREIAICNAGGAMYAIDDVCTHDGGSLDAGELLEFEVECPRHGARFDVRTGEVTEGPAVLPVDTFPVRLDGQDVEVDV